MNGGSEASNHSDRTDEAVMQAPATHIDTLVR